MAITTEWLALCTLSRFLKRLNWLIVIKYKPATEGVENYRISLDKKGTLINYNIDGDYNKVLSEYKHM